MPLSNNLSFGNLFKMLLVILNECLKRSVYLGLPSDYLRLGKLSKIHFDKEGLDSLEGLKDF